MKAALFLCACQGGKGLLALDADGQVASLAVGRGGQQLVRHLGHFVASAPVVAESDEDGAEMAFAEVGEDVHFVRLVVLCCFAVWLRLRCGGRT